MKVKIIALVVILAAAGIAYYWYQIRSPRVQIIPVQNINMKITSVSFNDGGVIPPKFTCDGDKINPELSVADVPQNAKSLALIMSYPDVPQGTFIHWVMWNIPVDTKTIPENSVPASAEQGRNGANKNNYIGPCPPSGTHRYFFNLYTLDTILSLPSSTGSQELQKAMNGHILDEAQLMGTYKRASKI